VANQRWSASRIGCYNQCPVRYKNVYINELVAVGGKKADVTQKGTDFHEIAEWMESNKDYEDLVFYTKSKLKDATYDTEKYPVLKTMPRFWQFWEKEVKAREALGFKYVKEGWQNFSIGKCKQFVGALDLCLYGPNGEVYIFDYKSGGRAAISDDYARQLQIYALAIGERLGYDIPKIIEKTKCALFFPLAGLKDEEATDPLVAAKMMSKSLKYLELTENGLNDTIEAINAVVDGSEKTDWKTIGEMDGKIGYYCSYCEFIGSIKSQSEQKTFTPCTLSDNSGLRSQRGIKCITKAESKKSGI
jgi:hypothetical protein